MRRILSYELFEKTLAREIEHVNRDEFVIITAWRAGLSGNANRSRMRELKRDLHTRRFSFVKVDGIGQETSGPSVEKSLLVLNDRDSDSFKEQMLLFAEHYDQDFIVYGKDGKIVLLDKDGRVEKEYSSVELGTSDFHTRVGKKSFHFS